MLRTARCLTYRNVTCSGSYDFRYRSVINETVEARSLSSIHEVDDERISKLKIVMLTYIILK